jgi:hypothetical protein
MANVFLLSPAYGQQKTLYNRFFRWSRPSSTASSQGSRARRARLID